MEVGLAREIFFVLLAATIGGVGAKLLKLQPIIGYILAGVFFGTFLPIKGEGIQKLAELGAILLLFSIGLELSFKRLSRVFRSATIGAILQMISVSVIFYLILLALGFDKVSSLILSMGFSLSSTAVVVKILSDKGENQTIHGEVMIGWLLVQDLAVIPMMVILPVLAGADGSWLASGAGAIGGAMVVVSATVFLGKLVAPFLIHQIAATNSRELLVVSAVGLAMGTALLTSFFGISPALGAFLAGVVISETQENHAVFAETRPLRDLFVALFFVTLGFLVTPGVVGNYFWIILGLVLAVLIIKALVVVFLSFLLGYYGKTAISIALGLSQIGEFSFIILSTAGVLKLVSGEIVTIGIATTLVSLLATPFLFKSIIPLWRLAREKTRRWEGLHNRFIGWKKTSGETPEFTGHIVICGYGRVGSWIGKALDSLSIPFVVIDYNQGVVQEVRMKGIPVIYGDPAEPEVLEEANLKEAKVLVVAIPDRVAQEELIANVQNIAPKVKIISRVHFDEDFEKMKILKVDKVVQPEFEAAIAIIRTILVSMGKGKEEINLRTKALRLSHASL